MIRGFVIAVALARQSAGFLMVPLSRQGHRASQALATPSVSHLVSGIGSHAPRPAQSRVVSHAKASFADQAKRQRAAADQGRMELLCKAGPDGVSLGDCPFCHSVQLVLRHKGLSYRLVPLAPDDKPEWLLEGYGGKMPCLVHDEEAYTDSATIAQYLDYFFPGDEPLSLEDDDPDLDEKIKEATGGVFGAFAKYIKNLDRQQDPELQKTLFAELEKVDNLLRESGGPFLAGDRISMDDFALAPKLYHLKVALAHFKNAIVPPKYDALTKYMNTMFDLDIFQKSGYRPDVVVWGWTNARS